VQIGNCGSPIEIDEGWLLLTHGVGAMRQYSIGAALLDKQNPGRVLARTAFVDVQKDRLECTIIGWQAGEEAWVMDHIIVPGDTTQPETWARFFEELQHYAPAALAVDSGYNTTMVYEFVSKLRYAFAIKGVPGPGRPLVEDERARRQRLRRQRKKGITVHMVGVDQAKALLFSRLKIIKPGAGYVHFPNEPSFDDEYFAQLTAEKLVTKIRGTRPYAEWVQTRPRNEALDCFVYAHAALRLSGIDLEALNKKRDAPVAAAPQPRPRRSSGFIKNW
jgi:phage terminase large subunit GpA-like protein